MAAVLTEGAPELNASAGALERLTPGPRDAPPEPPGRLVNSRRAGSVGFVRANERVLCQCVSNEFRSVARATWT